MVFYKCKICDQVWNMREIKQHIRGHFEGDKINNFIEKVQTLGKWE